MNTNYKLTIILRNRIQNKKTLAKYLWTNLFINIGYIPFAPQELDSDTSAFHPSKPASFLK